MTANDHVQSWYASTANPFARPPSLTEAEKADVCVIGGGFTGLSAALELAQRGLSVVLLEANRIAWGASGRNGGQIVPHYNKDYDWLAKRIGTSNARAMADMNREAVQLIRDRVARHDIKCNLRDGLFMGAHKPRQQRESEEEIDCLRRYGDTTTELVEGNDAVRRFVNTDAYVGGLHVPTGGHLHPLNYAQGLADAARAAGARLYEGSRVTRVDDGPSVTVHTDKGQVTAGRVVYAGNAYIERRLTKGFGSRIMPVGTYVMATEPLPAELLDQAIPDNHAIEDLNFVITYYRRSPDNRILFGSAVSYSTFDRPDRKHALNRQMKALLPMLADARPALCWGGFVDITVNRMPDFGRVGANSYYLQGFSGHGVATTGLAGKLVAEAIAGDAGRFDIFTKIRHTPFHGGPLLRTPALVLAMLWFRMRDYL